MPAEKKSFINVDELMLRVGVEQATAYYGAVLPELKRVGAEVRTRCFLQCGRTCETGDRVLAIQAEHAAKQWKCFHGGCGKSGNLIALCDLLKPGENAGGRPRGERFKQIATDLKSMVEGVVRPEGAPTAPAVPAAAKPKPQNVPLARSENERARTLTELDRKFVVGVAAMPPKASAYLRRRPFLTPDVCRKWRMGYLPRDVGEDKSGGTMRGKIVYPWLSESGEVLTWFGRDPEFEDRHRQWQTSDRTAKEPEKFHFVKGFHRGLELFGQHRLREPELAWSLREVGLLVVEGPNDAIRLGTLGVAAVALCAEAVTRDQAAKTARLARELAGGVVTVFLDCDDAGEAGMKQCLGYLAQLTPVRLAWTGKMYGGKFKGRQPESLTPDEWAEIRAYLQTGAASGWTLD